MRGKNSEVMDNGRWKEILTTKPCVSPDARLEMSLRYCMIVQRVSTSTLMELTYILTRGITPGNSS